MVRSVEVAGPGSPIDTGGGRSREQTATDCGLVLGAILTSVPGRALTHGDCLYIQNATQRSLEAVPSDQASNWCNPDTGNSGAVIAFAAEVRPSDQHSRAFQQTIVARGLTQQACGIACRQSDGTWKLAD